MNKKPDKHPELFPLPPVKEPEPEAPPAAPESAVRQEEGAPDDAPPEEEQPTREEWLALFEAAARFKDARPWEHMYDMDLFGVRDPDSGTTGYCSVMGQGGQHFALGVYPGGEGLYSFHSVAEAGSRGHELELGVAANMQKCIMASFEDRNTLPAGNRELIKELGLKFRGRKSWPLFQRHDPVFEPWPVSGPQAKFLTIALDQTLLVAEQFRAREQYLLGPLKTDKVLVRVSEDGKGGLWADRVEPFEQYEGFEIGYSRQTMAELAQLPLKEGFVLDIPHGVLPGLVKEQRGQRGYFPHCLLFVDGNSGLTLKVSMLSPEQFPRELLETIVTPLLEMGVMPAEIRLSDRFLGRFLATELEGFKTSVRLYESLPQAEHAFQSIFSRFSFGP